MNMKRVSLSDGDLHVVVHCMRPDDDDKIRPCDECSLPFDVCDGCDFYAGDCVFK